VKFFFFLLELIRVISSFQLNIDVHIFFLKFYSVIDDMPQFFEDGHKVIFIRDRRLDFQVFALNEK
jgi:Tol biopolymer transport system component